MLRRYFDVLEKKPLLVKVISAIAIFSVADIAAQVYEQVTECSKQNNSPIQPMEESCSVRIPFPPEVNLSWDVQRTGRMAAFGGIVNIWIHGWWGLLERQLERVISSKAKRYQNAAVKVLIDQSIGSPVFNVIFFSSQKAMEGCDLQEITEAVKVRLPVQLARHYTFWPAIHLINFSFVPFHRRVIVQNVLVVGWAAYMSRCETDFNNEALLKKNMCMDKSIYSIKDVSANVDAAKDS